MNKIELYNDHFQNYKVYGIPKAQLVIADIPYNLSNNFYASRPDWYVGFDNKLSNKALEKVEYIYSNTFDDRSLKREPTFNELIGLNMNSQTEELELTTTPLMQIEKEE